MNILNLLSMFLYIKDISKKHQKSVLDYTQNYLTELIPPHFVKLRILKIFLDMN